MKIFEITTLKFDVLLTEVHCGCTCRWSPFSSALLYEKGQCPAAIPQADWECLHGESQIDKGWCGGSTGVRGGGGRWERENATTISTLQTKACSPALWGSSDDIRETAGTARRLSPCRDGVAAPSGEDRAGLVCSESHKNTHTDTHICEHKRTHQYLHISIWLLIYISSHKHCSLKYF